MFGICLYMYFARRWALLFWALVVIILIRFRTSSFTSFKFSIYIPFHPEIFGAGMLCLFKQTVTRKTNNSLNVSPHLVIVLNFACYLVLVQAIRKTNIHLCSLKSSVSRRLGPRVLLRWYSCHALLVYWRKIHYGDCLMQSGLADDKLLHSNAVVQDVIQWKHTLTAQFLMDCLTFNQKSSR